MHTLAKFQETRSNIKNEDMYKKNKKTLCIIVPRKSIPSTNGASPHARPSRQSRTPYNDLLPKGAAEGRNWSVAKKGQKEY